MEMHAWLACAAFVGFAILWIILPSRLIHRNRRSSALLRPSEEGTSSNASEVHGQKDILTQQEAEMA